MFVKSTRLENIVPQGGPPAAFVAGTGLVAHCAAHPTMSPLRRSFGREFGRESGRAEIGIHGFFEHLDDHR